MDFRLSNILGGSPSSSDSSSGQKSINSRLNTVNHNNGNHSNHSNNGNNNNNHYNNGGDRHENDDPMHSWWESVSKARSRIHLLSSLLPPSSVTAASLDSIADSDRPARSLLSSLEAYSAISSSLSSPLSGSGDDPLCQWLYETYQSSDSDLRLVVLSFLPLLSGLYLSRIHTVSESHTPSLAGFEAVLLSLYAAETKSRAGKPVLISIPDLSQPSLYHTPRNKPNPGQIPQSRPSIGVVSAPLEPQIAVKSTKRACIVGVALDCYYKQISQMPSWSKLDLCRFAADWAGQDCPCNSEFDNPVDDFERNGLSDGIRVCEVEDVAEQMGNIEITENESSSDELVPRGARIPLPWELLQPVLRILGHCLLAPLNASEVKDAASVAVRSLYARATHELVPQAILAARSLIQLDKRTRNAAKVATMADSASSANTPSKAKKPEILLVSK